MAFVFGWGIDGGEALGLGLDLGDWGEGGRDKACVKVRECAK